MTNKFDFVSVMKKSNVHFGGLSISHVIKLVDGTQKTLGVFLPSKQPLVFRTHVFERIEIISGECHVQIGQDPEIHLVRAGEYFDIPENSQFSVTVNEVVDYVCHLEK